MATVASIQFYLMVLPSPAAACDPHTMDSARTNNFDPINRTSWYFDGWYSTNNANSRLHSVVATIEEKSPFIYPVSNNANTTSAWVMLAQGSVYWAQIGWIKDDSTARHVFVEWNSLSSSNKLLYSPQTVGETTRYRVQHSGSTYDFWMNGVLQDQIAISFTQDNAQNFAEIHTRRSEVPGPTSNHEGFTDVDLIDPNANTYDFDGTNGTHPSWAGIRTASSVHEEVWDEDCNS